jgi:EamA domain-containing membrane protein RarD
MAGQVYLVLGLLSFSLLGILHKVADVKQSRPSAINALLFSSSLLLVLLYVLFVTPTGAAAPVRVATIAIPFGVASSVAILAFQAGIKHGSIATSWLAINLSAGIPTVASILVYDEPVSIGKAVALSLIPLSMFLLWKDKAEEERRRA